MKQMEKTNELVQAAMFMSLIIVAQTLLRLPIPGTQGYIHMADAVIFLAVLKMGWREGALIAGLGSALGELLCGFAFWVPWTLFIKAGMAVALGLCIIKDRSQSRMITGMILGGLFMTAGYFGADWFMYGNYLIAAAGIPWNIAQFAVGAFVAVLIQRRL